MMDTLCKTYLRATSTAPTCLALAVLALLVTLPRGTFGFHEGNGWVPWHQYWSPLVRHVPEPCLGVVFDLDKPIPHRLTGPFRYKLPSHGPTIAHFEWRAEVLHSGYPAATKSVLAPMVRVYLDDDADEWTKPLIDIPPQDAALLREHLAALLEATNDPALLDRAAWVRSDFEVRTIRHAAGRRYNIVYWSVMIFGLVGGVRLGVRNLLWAAQAVRESWRTLNEANRAEYQCPTCRYDIRGLPQPICPECGTPFAPEVRHA